MRCWRQCEGTGRKAAKKERPRGEARIGARARRSGRCSLQRFDQSSTPAWRRRCSFPSSRSRHPLRAAIMSAKPGRSPSHRRGWPAVERVDLQQVMLSGFSGRLFESAMPDQADFKSPFGPPCSKSDDGADVTSGLSSDGEGDRALLSATNGDRWLIGGRRVGCLLGAVDLLNQMSAGRLFETSVSGRQ